MASSEKVLWSFLRSDRTGFRFRTQHAVGPYILDFYCPEASLCVEVDGEQHLDRVDFDEVRDLWLEARGIYTIRIPSQDLFDPTTVGVQAWVNRIVVKCEVRAGRTGSA